MKCPPFVFVIGFVLYYLTNGVESDDQLNIITRQNYQASISSWNDNEGIGLGLKTNENDSQYSVRLNSIEYRFWDYFLAKYDDLAKTDRQNDFQKEVQSVDNGFIDWGFWTGRSSFFLFNYENAVKLMEDKIIEMAYQWPINTVNEILNLAQKVLDLRVRQQNQHGIPDDNDLEAVKKYENHEKVIKLWRIVLEAVKGTDEKKFWVTFFQKYSENLAKTFLNRNWSPDGLINWDFFIKKTEKTRENHVEAIGRVKNIINNNPAKWDKNIREELFNLASGVGNRRKQQLDYEVANIWANLAVAIRG